VELVPPNHSFKLRKGEMREKLESDLEDSNSP